MSYLKIFFIFLFFFTIASCGKEERISVLQDEDLESQMIALYYEGYEEFLDGDSIYAAKKFNEAELIFPQSEWAPIAALMTA